MGAKIVNQFVKSLLVLRAVGFGELVHCFFKFRVQPRSAGHSVAVSSGTPEKKEKKTNVEKFAFIIRAN